MAGKVFSNEELNFFKFSSIVFDEFPKMLRLSFIKLWDTKISTLAGYQTWDDSVHVRNLLFKREGGVTDIPTNKSINEWDCTTLVKATIYSNTFAVGRSKSKRTLHALYLKGKKPSPFHSSVISPSGNPDETLTLAIDQLRLLRNTLCHMSPPRIEQVDFDRYLELVEDAFTANEVSITSIENIGCLREEDFPTEKVNDLRKRREEECNKFLRQEVVDKISAFEGILQDMKKLAKNDFPQFQQEVVDKFSGLGRILEDMKEAAKNDRKFQELFLQEVADKFSGLERMLEDMKEASKNDNTPRIPDSCVPPLISQFVGRDNECKAIIESMMSQSKRLFSIWGSPGFGKTTTAIKIGNSLKSLEKLVYYFSFRDVNTMEEFISRLLCVFAQTTQSMKDANLKPQDALLSAIRCIDVRIFVILDNLDNLLTTSEQKEVMTGFITRLLNLCPNVCLLSTTRESLEFIKLRMSAFYPLRLKPLDTKSCQILIRSILHSGDTKDIQNRVSKMCGNIPLAIRLLCSFIKDNPLELLEEISQGSESILDVLDDPTLSADARLKELIQMSFCKLSGVEKETFIALSVFEGDEFGLDDGVSIVGGNKLKTIRHIKNLEIKSLIDVSHGSKSYSIHPLIQSFALEKAEKEMPKVLKSSKTRFYEHYITLFESLNSKFLNGDSLCAWETFYPVKRRIQASLTNGLNDDQLLKKIFSVLQRSECFLDCLLHHTETKLLYESALSKATDPEDIAGLHASKQLFLVTLDGEKTKEQNDETNAKIFPVPSPAQGKFLCYNGLNKLSKGFDDSAAQQVKKGLSLLSNNPEHHFLKNLAFQLLAVYYQCSGNITEHEEFLQKAVEKSAEISLLPPLYLTTWEKDEKPSKSNLPFNVWDMGRFLLWTAKFRGRKFNPEFESNLRVHVLMLA